MALVAKHIFQSTLGIARMQSALGFARMPSSATILQTVRIISTTSVKHGDNRSLMKLKKLQADYQCEDGRPIFLKAGLRDRLLYGFVIILCYVGVLNVFGVIYDNAKPASWKAETVC